MKSNKHYVFFANSIVGVGGAELYIKTKAQYLEENGWKVSIIHNKRGETYIKEFCDFNTLFVPETHKMSFMYLSWKRNRIVDKIMRFLGDAVEETVFESHSEPPASWAELVASKYGKVRHIVYHLNEILSVPSSMFQFFKFKYERKELFGINEKSIELFFHKTGYKLNYGSPKLLAHGCNECVFDIPSTINTDDWSGYIIGIFGRLDKPYIYEYAKVVQQFSIEHREESFTVVIIGGEPKGSTVRIQIIKLFEESQNVKLVMTGYHFPIPRELVTHFNICLAGAGAANAIKREGITTIVADPRDLMSSGVLGVTTQKSLFSDEKKEPLSWWINEVYEHPELYRLERISVQYDFSDHFDALKNCSPVIEYDLSFLKYHLSFVDSCKKILNSVLPYLLRESMAGLVRAIKK